MDDPVCLSLQSNFIFPPVKTEACCRSLRGFACVQADPAEKKKEANEEP